MCSFLVVVACLNKKVSGIPLSQNNNRKVCYPLAAPRICLCVCDCNGPQRTLHAISEPKRSSPSMWAARMKPTCVTMATACLAGGCFGNGSTRGRRKLRCGGRDGESLVLSSAKFIHRPRLTHSLIGCIYLIHYLYIWIVRRISG